MSIQLTCPSCRAEIPQGSAFCPSCGKPSPTVISSERATVTPVSAAAATTETTGMRLARALGPKYEVRRLVGQGGFAEVYELGDLDLDRRLACKVLHPEIAWTPGMIARFRQEAKALARLQHPAILPIHFTGDGEGLAYYVMPFVEGESLAEALRRGRMLPVEDALRIAEPILEALSHAHTQGLVHRDIKPDNVMLEARTGRVLLVDFGIAKLLDPGPEGTKTATGFTVGTVQYMSPEQALGQADLDGRSDLYAFGAMLFQMVTGAPPFDGKSSAEIVGKHLADPVPVASDVNTKIPRWLSDVILKCLAKKPEERFQSAEAVLGALHAGRASGSARLVGSRTVERELRRSAGGSGSRRLRVWALLICGVAIGAAGLYAWRAVFGGRSAVWVENALVEPVEVLRNDAPVDTVAPGKSVRVWAPRRADVRMGWRLLRPGNPPLGESMEGPMPAEASRLGRRVWQLTPVVGGQRFFAPLVTNTTPSDVTLEVNPGTTAAVRCGCLVARGAVRAHIGYYHLYANSTVAAYNVAHPYTGPHSDRGDFAATVPSSSGAIELTY